MDKSENSSETKRESDNNNQNSRNDNDMSNSKHHHRKRKKQFYNAIRNQMEFYFSDANLSKDRFLKKLIADDPCKSAYTKCKNGKRIHSLFYSLSFQLFRLANL